MRKSKIELSLINVIGIDGAGKTKLSKALIEKLKKKDNEFVYVHSYHEPLILRPLKFIARLIFLRFNNESVDYSQYRTRKLYVSNRHNILSSIYGLIWIIDYAIQAAMRVGLLRFLGRRIIIDRYIFDTVLNASLTANWTPETTYRILGTLLKLLPRPDVVFLIDLPAKIAFERKKDIQAVEYLQERRYLYLVIAEKFGFIKLDGQDKSQAVLAQALQSLP
jgi:thymidylate kinase